MAAGTKRMLLLCMLLVTAILVCFYGGMLRCPEGRSEIIKVACRLRGHLLSIRDEERSYLWHAKSEAIQILFELPMFLVGFGGERSELFEASLCACGNVAPFRHGLSFSTHESVSEVMQSQNQPRGPYIGALPMPSECFRHDTLIFQSTGKEHTRVRKFLAKAVHAFSADSFPPVELPAGVSRANATAEEIDRTVVMNLFLRMFGRIPSEEEVDVMVEYFVYGGSCVLGKSFHKLAFGTLLTRVQNIREEVLAIVRGTETGERVIALAKDEGMGEEESTAMLVQVVDGFLFAGMFGTSHLTGRTIARIRSDPPLYVSQWEESKRRFLLEQARVDPPVTSVTAVLGEPTDIALSLWPERPITFSAGTTVQLFISNANTDPDVFGGPDRSIVRAKQFDPTRDQEQLDRILSFNGLEVSVAGGKAPRGCLGHHLALNLAQDIVDEFLPSHEAVESYRTEYHEEEEERLRLLAQNQLHKAYAEYRVESYLESTGDRNIFDVVGFSTWFLCCLACFLYLRLFGSSTASVYHYSFYLVGQMWVCVGGVFMTIRLPIFYMGQLISATAYGMMYLDVRGYSRASQWLLLGVGVFAATLVIIISQVFGYVFPLPAVQAITAVLYTPCAALAMALLAIVAYETRQAKYMVGALGGIFGVVNLFWPLFFNPVYYHLLSRVADSTLYIPLVLRAVMSMTSKEERKLLHERGRGAARDHAKKVSISKPGFGLSTIHISVALVVIVVAATAQQGLYGWADANGCPYIDLETADEATVTACEHASHALSDMDFYVKLFFRILKMQHEQEKADVPTTNVLAQNMTKPWFTGRLTKKHLHFGVMAPVEDPEDAPINSMSDEVQAYVEDSLDWVLRTLPLADIDLQWKSLEYAREAMEVVSRGDVPEATIDWSKVEGGVTSDGALSLMAFGGIAAHRLVRVGSDAYNLLGETLKEAAREYSAEFVCDFSWMSKLETREGFEPYGAAAFFDSEGTLVAIYWPLAGRTLTSQDRQWAHAKWVWRSSAVTGVTLRDHLIGIHLMIANWMATANVEELSPEHPIRTFLRPFTYRTFKINRGATTYLCEKNGLLHRAVGLSFHGLKQGMKYSFSTLRFATVPQLIESQGLQDLGDLHSWAADVRGFYDVLFEYTAKYVDLYYADTYDVLHDNELNNFMDAMRKLPNSKIPQMRSKEDLKNLLTNFVMHVTAVHSHVGNVAEYLMDAEFVGAKLREGRNMADVQSSFQSMGIALLTGWKVPALLDNFEHLVLEDDHKQEAISLMRTFQSEMTALADNIDERNERRPFPTNILNPRKMHSSVSI